MMRPPVNARLGLGDLIGVGEMHLRAIPDARRANGEFGAANPRFRDGDRNEDARFADIVVVEEIHAARFEVVDVERPAANRNRDAELMLFIAFAVQRREACSRWSRKDR